ncbi:MAG: TetR/AcrR family transcriptional regulator [Desulfotomaculum sp.]|nr:TetR/AcrR family transcriptional regulator [Desulfotomaculum sp.]
MKERIIQVAMDRLAKFGLKSFTVDDITAELGISKKTVYRYFNSKHEIIGAVIDMYVEMEKQRTLKALDTKGNWLDKLNEVISVHIQEERPDSLLSELKHSYPVEWKKAEAIKNFKKEKVRELLKEGIKQGDINPSISTAVIELTLQSTLEALFDFDFLNQNNMTVNQARNELRKIILYGILKR